MTKDHPGEWAPSGLFFTLRPRKKPKTFLDLLGIKDMQNQAAMNHDVVAGFDGHRARIRPDLPPAKLEGGDVPIDRNNPRGNRQTHGISKGPKGR